MDWDKLVLLKNHLGWGCTQGQSPYLACRYCPQHCKKKMASSLEPGAPPPHCVIPRVKIVQTKPQTHKSPSEGAEPCAANTVGLKSETRWVISAARELEDTLSPYSEFYIGLDL